MIRGEGAIIFAHCTVICILQFSKKVSLYFFCILGFQYFGFMELIA